MKFMLLIHQGTTPIPGTDAWESLSEEERSAIYAAYQAIKETPGVSPGLQLEAPEAAITVRTKGGKLVTTDGPFAETKEAVGGYLLFEAGSAEEAVELAARIPAAKHGGAVEVRPIVEW